MSTLVAQLFTLRSFLKTPEDFKTTFKKVREIGYEAVQVSGIGDYDPSEVKKIADDNGLKIVCTHIPYDRFLNDIPGIVRDHNIMDCTTAGVGSLPKDMRNEEGFFKFAKDFTNAARELKKEGIDTTYHNHRFEFEKFNGKTGFDILKENSDTFTFLIDTYWVQAGGADPAKMIIDYSDRVELIHFKDMLIKNDEAIMAEVMEGNLNWDAIFDACKKANIKWHIVEQDTCYRDPFESLAISYNNLKKKGF